MKYAKYPLILLFVALVTGCIFEGMDECYSTIRFSYTGDNGDEAQFADKIKKVDLYVFDEDENLVLEHTLTPSELDSRSARVLLPPGKTYHAVAIGNANNSSPHMLHEGEIDKMQIIHNAVHPDIETANRQLESHDHLYHGSMMNIAIPKAGEYTTEPIQMNASHFDMSVKVIGYNEQTGPTRQGDDVSISIEHTNMPVWIDFENRHSKHSHFTEDVAQTHYPKGAIADDSNGYLFEYSVLRHVPTEDDDSEIILRDSRGNEVYRLSVMNYLAEFGEGQGLMRPDGSFNTDLHEKPIAIEIEFLNIGVEVRIPDWAIVDTTPDF